MKKGRLIRRKCSNCKRILIPPRMYCEQCYRPTDEWEYVRDTGTINTFSISHVGTDVRRLSKPILEAEFDIGGASRGLCILHTHAEVEPDKVSIAMNVTADGN